jgi:hypothetical protein
MENSTKAGLSSKRVSRIRAFINDCLDPGCMARSVEAARHSYLINDNPVKSRAFVSGMVCVRRWLLQTFRVGSVKGRQRTFAQ